MVEKAGLSKKSLETLRKLIAVKGSKVFDVAEEMKNCVEGYGKAVDAVQNLSDILTLVSETGCKIDMTVDAGFARGLEYYTGMISELYVPDLNIALGGGGRYDRLIGLFGGAATPAVGIAHGLDRIMLALQEQKTTPENRKEKTVMIVSTSDRLRGEALKIAQVLREADVRVEMEVMRRKMSKALEDADRKEIDYLVIVGERELREGAVAVRNLRTREQKTTKLENIVKTIKE
jgi:histidyl-tRNA synthetase